MNAILRDKLPTIALAGIIAAMIWLFRSAIIRAAALGWLEPDCASGDGHQTHSIAAKNPEIPKTLRRFMSACLAMQHQYAP